MRNIGLILALQQRHAEALPWLDRAAAIRKESTSSEDAGLEGIRVQRAWIVFRLGRRMEGLDQAARGVTPLERIKESDAEHWLAHSRLLLARMLTRVTRPDEAEPVARAAMSWFARWGPNHPKYADAECELGRALVLRGQTAEGRASLERCLPIYRAWGQANREIVESNERLLTRIRSLARPWPAGAASAPPP